MKVNKREEREHGEGRDVYDTLLQSDTTHPYELYFPTVSMCLFSSEQKKTRVKGRKESR